MVEHMALVSIPSTTTKRGSAARARVAEATKGYTLIASHLPQSQPFLFIFKQCDNQTEYVKYVCSINKTRLCKVQKMKQSDNDYSIQINGQRLP